MPKVSWLLACVPLFVTACSDGRLSTNRPPNDPANPRAPEGPMIVPVMPGSAPTVTPAEPPPASSSMPGMHHGGPP